jgi:hypothetical protein
MRHYNKQSKQNKSRKWFARNKADQISKKNLSNKSEARVKDKHDEKDKTFYTIKAKDKYGRSKQLNFFNGDDTDLLWLCIDNNVTVDKVNIRKVFIN